MNTKIQPPSVLLMLVAFCLIPVLGITALMSGSLLYTFLFWIYLIYFAGSFLYLLGGLFSGHL